jgi:hypothetical protein
MPLASLRAAFESLSGTVRAGTGPQRHLREGTIHQPGTLGREQIMLNKISIVGGLGLVLSTLAAAQKAPAPPTAASLLGTIDGTVNFCTKVNPKSAAKFKEMGQLITNGQSDEAIAQIRDSKEYKDTLDQTSKKLAALSTKEAAETCKVPAK